jgi:hypothetical protein
MDPWSPLQILHNLGIPLILVGLDSWFPVTLTAPAIILGDLGPMWTHTTFQVPGLSVPWPAPTSDLVLFKRSQPMNTAVNLWVEGPRGRFQDNLRELEVEKRQ